MLVKIWVGKAFTKINHSVGCDGWAKWKATASYNATQLQVQALVSTITDLIIPTEAYFIDQPEAQHTTILMAQVMDLQDQ